MYLVLGMAERTKEISFMCYEKLDDAMAEIDWLKSCHDCIATQITEYVDTRDLRDKIAAFRKEHDKS